MEPSAVPTTGGATKLLKSLPDGMTFELNLEKDE
jgi:hypothetical protein